MSQGHLIQERPGPPAVRERGGWKGSTGAARVPTSDKLDCILLHAKAPNRKGPDYTERAAESQRGAGIA